MAYLGVRARVALLPTAESGRTMPIRTPYRGMFAFAPADPDDPGCVSGGELRLEDRAACGPGEECAALIMFLAPDRLPLQVGAAFEIREGARPVARGTVLGLVDWRRGPDGWLPAPIDAP